MIALAVTAAGACNGAAVTVSRLDGGGGTGSGGVPGTGAASGATGGAGVIGTGGRSGDSGAVSGSGGTPGAGTGGSAGQPAIDAGAGTGGARDGGSTDANARSGEFLALTYNVAGLPEGLSGSNPSVNTKYISPLLNDYDLVLVQEDWKEPRISLLTVLGYHVYHDVLAADARHPYKSTPLPIPQGTDLSRPTALVSDGLNYFSNFAFPDPPVRVRWTDCFGDQSQGAGDCLAQKGFAIATVTIAPGAVVDVYTLHAEAGSTPKDQTLQVADFQQLADYIVARAAGRAIILGGDTNLHTEMEEDRVIWSSFLQRAGLTDVCQTVGCGADVNEIDRFAYRGNDTLTITPVTHVFEREKFVRPTDGQPLSDHPALSVRFKWSLR